MAMALKESDVQEEVREEKKTAEVIFGGSLAEVLISCIAIALAIAGFLTASPEILLSGAIVVLGAALLFESAPTSLRLYNLLPKAVQKRLNIEEAGIETTVESLTVIFAAVLGVLAVLEIKPMILIPAAIIMIGGCMILGAAASNQLNSLVTVKSRRHPTTQDLTRQLVTVVNLIQGIVGLSAIALGILALYGIEPMTLCLVAILGMSLSAFLSGSALSGRMFSQFGS